MLGRTSHPNGIIDNVTTPPAFGIAVREDGLTYFTEVFNGGVGITSTQTHFVPNGFAVHPDGRLMYVSAALGGTVTEMDMCTGTVLRTFTLGGRPQDMAVTHQGDRLYVGNEAGYLNEIDLQSGAPTATITLAGGAFGIGVTPDDNQAYISIPSQGLVQVFYLQPRRLAFNLTVGGRPRRIGFSQLGHIGAVANEAGFVTFVR